MSDKEGPVIESIERTAQAFREASDLILKAVRENIEIKARAVLVKWSQEENWPAGIAAETMAKDMESIGFVQGELQPNEFLDRMYEPLPIGEGKLRYCIQMLQALINGKARAFATTYDKDKGMLTVIVGRDLSRDYGQSAQIDFPMAESDYQALEAAYQQKMSQVVEAIKNQAAAQEALLNSPLSGDITIGDILSYPRWTVERDAERGKLTGLRAIRAETGLNLLGLLSVISPSLKKFRQQHASQDFRRSLTKEENDIMERRMEAIEQGEKEGYYAPTRAVENVRGYMGHIGATPRNVRKFRNHTVGKQELKTEEPEDLSQAA